MSKIDLQFDDCYIVEVDGIERARFRLTVMGLCKATLWKNDYQKEYPKSVVRVISLPGVDYSCPDGLDKYERWIVENYEE